MDANQLLEIRRSRREFLLLGAGLLVAACGGGSSSSSSGSAVASVEATGDRLTIVDGTRPAATVAPSPTATTRPAGIEVRGTDDFKSWTQQALDLLKTKAAPEFQLVTDSIWIIESVAAGSGINVQEKRYKVGDQTAHAPGHATAQQLIWYAGTIVHDANHSALYAKGQTYSGKDAEVACLKVQKQALLKIETSSYFSGYVQGLIDGADDPANQYWTQANRHW